MARANCSNVCLVSPFIKHKDHITGFVYDVTDGLLHPVD